MDTRRFLPSTTSASSPTMPDLIDWIIFVLFFPFKIVASIWIFLYSLIGVVLTSLGLANDLEDRSRFKEDEDGEMRSAVDVTRWKSPPYRTAPISTTVSGHGHQKAYHDLPEQPTHFGAQSPNGSMYATENDADLRLQQSSTGRLDTTRNFQPKSISLPPRNLSKRSLAPTQGDTNLRPLSAPHWHHTTSTLFLRKTRKLRDTHGYLGFFQSTSHLRIPHPSPESTTQAQEGDIYLNLVESENRYQLWMWEAGAWVRVGVGHRVMRPPETEPRYLAVTKGGQASLVKVGTWVASYRSGRECPVIPP